MKIEMRHGSGGADTSALIDTIFAKHFKNEILSRMEDAAVLPRPAGKMAFTTDSFVVQPPEFAGGDIGRLSVCGTVNDLCCMGAVPRYLTAGFILEEGLESETLERIAASMAKTAAEAGVCIVAGDTKVVGGNGGLFINTAGVGEIPAGRNVSAANLRPGDRLILTGTLGEHHAVILCARIGLQTPLRSDCAPLCGITEALFASGAARPRGGILGLAVLTMGNEGKMLLAVPDADAQRALEAVRRSPYGENAALVGEVRKGSGAVLETAVGGRRVLSPLRGEGLPRIC